MKKLLTLLLCLLIPASQALCEAPRQTALALAEAWGTQYADSPNMTGDEANPDPSPDDKKLHRIIALQLAIDHILTTYDIAYDALAAHVPMVFYSPSSDTWNVNLAPPDDGDSFEVQVHAETGIISLGYWGPGVG